MRKYHMTGKQMATAFLDEAASWSRDLTRMKVRGPGDTENAMRLVEREYGIDYWVQWRLRYRRRELKDIGVSVYMALKAAYQAECERQIRKLQNEIANSDPRDVAQAQAFLEEIEKVRAK